MIFAKKQLRFNFYLRSNICTNSDILVINIIDKTNSFLKTVQVINIYNEKSLEIDCNEYIIKRKLHEIMFNKNTILCKDLNTHYF